MVFTVLCWMVSILGACAGAVMLMSSFAEKGAPQQAAAAAVGIGFAVIPYCFTRAVSEIRREVRESDASESPSPMAPAAPPTPAASLDPPPTTPDLPPAAGKVGAVLTRRRRGTRAALTTSATLARASSSLHIQEPISQQPIGVEPPSQIRALLPIESPCLGCLRAPRRRADRPRAR